MDFKAAVESSIERIVASGAIEKSIDAAIEKAIKDALTSALSSYSEFGKAVEAAVKKSLAIQVGQIDLPEYSDLIVKVVRRQVDASIGAAIEKQVGDNLKRLLANPPAEMTAQQLIDEFKKSVKENAGCHCGPMPISVVYESSEDDSIPSLRGYWHLYLHDGKKPERDKYSFKYRLSITPDGEVYNLVVNGTDVETRLFLGPLYGFERLLFAMKTGRTKVIPPASADELDAEIYEYSD